MNGDTWEIEIIDASEVEAKVHVHYRGAANGQLGEQIVVRGTLRGPYCERAHTLPADYPFRGSTPGMATAEAVVTDPCLWSEELPHLYRASVQAMCGDEVVAEYHETVGLRRTTPVKNWDHIK